MAASAREQLLALLAEKSFRLGQFTLSSGGSSDYYIDCRLTTLHAGGARLTGVPCFCTKSASWLASASNWWNDFGRRPDCGCRRHAPAQRGKRAAGPTGLIHGFLVRKAEKTHGMGGGSKGTAKRARRW